MPKIRRPRSIRVDVLILWAHHFCALIRVVAGTKWLWQLMLIVECSGGLQVLYLGRLAPGCSYKPVARVDSPSANETEAYQEQRPQQLEVKTAKIRPVKHVEQVVEAEEEFQDAGAMENASDADASEVSNDGTHEADHDVEVQHFDVPVMERAAQRGVQAPLPKRTGPAPKGALVGAVHAQVTQSHGTCAVLVLFSASSFKGCADPVHTLAGIVGHTMPCPALHFCFA
jgi:hypothetical protein